jgi:hypothetical protein
MAKDYTYGNAYYCDIEYKMSKLMASELLKTRKGAEQNMRPQQFLCKIVNEQFGVKGNCVRVITTE